MATMDHWLFGLTLVTAIGSGLMAGFAGVFFFYAGLAAPGGDISRIRPIAFSLAPLSAVILGWLVLGEVMTVKKALATVLIVAGIVLLTGTSHAGGESSAPLAPEGAK